MRFVIIHSNHKAGLQDLALHLQRSLEAAGHHAGFGAQVSSGACNIMVENFTDTMAAALADAGKAGVDMLLWATEELTGETFNGALETSHAHYDNRAYWKYRYDCFVTVARHCRAVLVPVEGLVEPYSRAVPGVPVLFFPHGYAPGGDEIRHRAEADKDIDFHFSGSATAHRQAIVRRLAAKYVVETHQGGVAEPLRRDYVSRARVSLSLRLGPQTRLPSVSRLHHLLMNRCFALHEQCELQSHLDAFVEHTPGPALFEACEAALHAPDRRERAEDAFERFRMALPMREIVPGILDQVFARR